MVRVQHEMKNILRKDVGIGQFLEAQRKERKDVPQVH